MDSSKQYSLDMSPPCRRPLWASICAITGTYQAISALQSCGWLIKHSWSTRSTKTRSMEPSLGLPHLRSTSQCGTRSHLSSLSSPFKWLGGLGLTGPSRFARSSCSHWRLFLSYFKGTGQRCEKEVDMFRRRDRALCEICQHDIPCLEQAIYGK